MKKKKKLFNKKKKDNKKIKIVALVAIVIVIGIGVFIYYKTHDPYYNGYKSVCPEGYYYYNTLFGIFGSGCKKCPKGQYCKNDRHTACPNGLTTRKEGCSLAKDCSICKDSGKWFNGSSCVSCKSPNYCSGGEKKTCPKCNGSVTCFIAPDNSTSVNKCRGTVPAGKYISCNSSGCTVSACTGNTYSNKKNVNYSSSLKTQCTACPKGKKANRTHTGCV